MTLEIRISDVRVAIHCDAAVAMRALSAVWGHARGGCLTPTRSEAFEVSEREDGWNVRHGDRQIGRASVVEDIAPMVEAAIYARMPEWHLSDRTILHSACVVWMGRPILFLGDSGAGKSSLAWAAVRRGASYVTDDLVVTDGARLWGVPRAIQFDPIAAVDAVPPWLEETDRCSYPLRLFGDRRGFLPLVQLEAGRIAFESHSVRGVHLVLPKRGAKTELRSTHHLEGLAAIQSGVIGAIRTNLGGLVGPGRVTRLNWSSPDDAIEMLWATLSDDPC